MTWSTTALRRLSVFMAITLLCAASGTAQSAPDSGPLPPDRESLTLSERMLLEAEVAGESALSVGLERSHYDADGYPESAEGLLALSRSPDGPIAFLQGDPDPYLLYAQYSNRQRDAVFLARTGDVNDVLPNGSLRRVPYGYGAVKLNTVYVSLLESLLIPHFSDNQKEYVDFPLRDVYLGGAIGLTGVTVVARYVHTERYVGSVSVGFNPFGSFRAQSVLNRYWVPVQLGGGYRFPGLFPQFLGENLWTAGAELFLGFGDRDDDPATDAAVFLPGAYIDIERVLFDEAGIRRDYRTDPRPYNYRVNAVVFRIGAYLDLSNLGSGSVIMPTFGVSYQYNVIGPAIPPHEFKETRVLYLHELYREDLERQAERREARQNR